MEVKYVNFPAQFKEEKTKIMSAVERVLERGDFILGQDVEKFEQEFAQICDAKYAISAANGTDTLIMAMKALGIGPGDEVITPPNSWVSSTSSIALIGATPVFADVGPDQNISVKAIEAAITSKTKAIMPVHLTGRCADLEKILAVAKRHNLHVIEDSAQSVMAKIGNYTAGSAGIVSSFSLHPLKNLNACGDAGILTTNDASLAAKLKLMRNHGLKNRDEIEFWGYNSRLDTVQAAILRTRLESLKSTIEKRRVTARLYCAELKNIVECPIEKPNEYHTYHLFVAQCEKRNELKAFLEKKGIETKIHYPIPIHLQKAAEYLGHKEGDFPQTELQSKRILSLPIHQYLDEAQVSYVIKTVKEFYL